MKREIALNMVMLLIRWIDSDHVNHHHYRDSGKKGVGSGKYALKLRRGGGVLFLTSGQVSPTTVGNY